jgi:cation diffusion facilitator CzcD-associated flavoprotein CzcO
MENVSKINSKSKVVSEHKVIIVGCGHSGVINAYKLQEANISDFIILERADRAGGCWRENTYPGCACDVPSTFYSYSFRRNPDWSHSFPGQEEILGYIEDTIKELELNKKIRFNTEMFEAEWLPNEKRWSITTSAGEFRSQFVIFATGPLTDANIPEVNGLEDFSGEVFHSAQWNHDVDLEGKRVAVIGTGASAIQFIPEVQKVAKHVTVFQRTAPWVLPRPMSREISGIEKFINRHTSILQNLSRRRIEMMLVPMNYGLTHPRVMKWVEPYVRNILKKQVRDKTLRDKVSPNFTIGCKRVLFSNDYYRALKKPNVDVIASGLNEVQGNKAIASNGESIEADVIIFGTGFQISPPPIAHMIRGMDGRLLAERWEEESAQAFVGTTMWDMPNAFVMIGPNILVYSSFIEIVEWQTGYIIDAIKKMDERGLETFRLKKKESDEYNDWIQKNLSNSVFSTGGCQSYYLDDKGRDIASWPWTISKLKKRLSEFDLINYQISQ